MHEFSDELFLFVRCSTGWEGGVVCSVADDGGHRMASDAVAAPDLARMITDRSALGIARAVELSIRAGRLRRGQRLPTVRALAAALYVGPTTVAQGWMTLRQRSLIVSRGRRGVFVLGEDPGWRAHRREDMALDLSKMWPDPAMVPLPEAPLLDAMVMLRAEAGSVGAEQLLLDPRFGARLRQLWPFAADSFAATTSARTAVAAVVATATSPGDRVLAESDFVFRDVLDSAGLEIIVVEADSQGSMPRSLRTKLNLGAHLFFYQSRMSHPAGHSLDEERASELAAMLAPGDLQLIEVDPTPELALRRPHSLGRWHPCRTLLVRAWTLSHGPLLRVGAAGGASHLVELVRQWTLTSGVWPSTWHQRALGLMLDDDAVRHQVKLAALTYARRRRELVVALDRAGLSVPGGEGLSVWLPVPDPTSATELLAQRGIAVAPRGPWSARGRPGDHVNIVTTLPHRSHLEIASVLACLARPMATTG